MSTQRNQPLVDAFKLQLEGLANEESAKPLMEVVFDTIVSRPENIDSDVFNMFLREYLPGKIFNSDMFISKDILERIEASANKSKSWLKFEVFLSRALQLEVLSPSSLEDAVLPLLKEDLHENLMMNFASCLNSVIESYKRKTGSSDEFLQILEWVAWAYSNSDQDLPL